MFLAVANARLEAADGGVLSSGSLSAGGQRRTQEHTGQVLTATDSARPTCTCRCRWHQSKTDRAAAAGTLQVSTGTSLVHCAV